MSKRFYENLDVAYEARNLMESVATQYIPYSTTLTLRQWFNSYHHSVDDYAIRQANNETRYVEIHAGDIVVILHWSLGSRCTLSFLLSYKGEFKACPMYILNSTYIPEAS